MENKSNHQLYNNHDYKSDDLRIKEEKSFYNDINNASGYAMTDAEKIIGRLDALAEYSGKMSFLILSECIKKRSLIVENEEAIKAITQFAVQAFIKFYRIHGIDPENKKDNTTLYLISTLPLWLRIEVWHGVAEFNRSYTVIEKLSMAYAKNGQLCEARQEIEQWIKKGYLRCEYAEDLISKCEMLALKRSEFPIAEDMRRAKENYKLAMGAVQNPNEVYEDFKGVMEMLVG